MLLIALFGLMPMCGVVAEEYEMEEMIEYVGDDIVADAIEEYEVQGSLFQQITDLEQEKVLMQLEKERAQLNLDLDRLAAEKIKLHMEIDALSGRAETQQQELETQMAKLEAEAARLAREKGIDCEVSLENMMACGIGACLCCVVDSDEGHKCVCKEGPVFNAKKLTNWIKQ